MSLNNPSFARPEIIDGRTLLQEKQPKTLHVDVIDASMLARQCQEQIAALSALAGMSRKDAMLTGKEWMSLLDPIAEQLLVLRQMLDHRVETAENRLVKVGG